MSFALGGVASVVVVSIAKARYNRAVRSTLGVTSVWLAQGARSFHNTVNLVLNEVGKEVGQCRPRAPRVASEHGRCAAAPCPRLCIGRGSDAKVKEELLDLDLSHKDVASGLEGSHAVLSDDDADMVRDGIDVFAGSEKREEPPAPLVKLPDEAVFGFSGGMFKEEGARGGEEVYGLHSGDLACFTTSIGTNAGPGPGDGRHLGDLFGYGSAADFPRGRDSPVLLSIKDDELGDGSKEVARIKWDNEESYKLLDSIMEAEGSEKLDCVADDMMAAGSGQRLQADVEGSLLQDAKDAGEPAQ
ncbi:uncharacterized protein ISCGN_001929 [Ixodes scapularis]